MSDKHVVVYDLTRDIQNCFFFAYNCMYELPHVAIHTGAWF